MLDLTLKDLDEQTFQGIFEACGDSDPYGLVLDGQVIGLVLVRYDGGARAKLEGLGIAVTL